MTDWAGFVGLVAVVVVLFLALARLSAGTLDESTNPEAVDGRQIRAPAPEPPEPDEEGGQADRRPSVAGADTATAEGDGRADAAELAADELEHRPGDPDPRGGVGALSTAALLANVALTQGVFGAVVAVGALYFGVPLAALGLGPAAMTVGALLVGVVAGVVLWTANEAAGSVADAVGAGYDEALRELLAPEGLAGWAVLLGAVLPTVAVVEELLFRAALIGAPAAGFGLSPWPLVVLSAVAFALGHGAQGRVGVVVTGTLGAALAGAFVLTGSLLVVVVAHYLVNALEFLVHEGLGVDRPLGR